MSARPTTRFLFLALTGLALVSAPVTRAAVVSYAGAQIDVEANLQDTPQKGWRTASDPLKPLDPEVNIGHANPDNIFGTDGYQLFPSHFVNLPSYVAEAQISPAAGIATWGGGGTYAYMDNPDNPATDFQTGTYYLNGQAPGIEADMFSFTIGAGYLPATIRMGLIWDNTDNSGGLGSIEFRVRGAGGDSGYVALTTGNQSPDFYFFDLSGTSIGDTFTISVKNAATDGFARNLLVGGVTFDSAQPLIPEPGALSMAALGLVMVKLLQRKRFSPAVA